MVSFTHIWTCTCGAETECTAADQRIGAVYECPACKQVWGNLYPRRGGNAWVKVDPSDVKFHRLLEPAEEEDDEDLRRSAT